MNERITLLALKASDRKTGWLDRQKFAELIVAEVLAVQEKLIADGHNAWHLHGPTKKHFGVEE